MPNQIPLQSAVDAAGGFLVPLELGEPLVKKVAREQGAQALCESETITSNRKEWPVYLGRPTASFVGEGQAKPVTGAEYANLIVNIKKMATQVIYTEELLEDARVDPSVLVNADVEDAFRDLVDAHMIGTHPGGGSTQANFTTSFNDCLANTAQAIELGTGQDAFAVAISAAIETIEGNGGTPSGILLALDAKGHLRNARATDGRPLYVEGFDREPDSLYGLGFQYTTNLDGFPAALMGGAGSPAKVMAVVGDFSHARFVARSDLRVRIATEATIVAAGPVTHNLFQENKVAAQWEMRAGFQIFDRDRQFVKIVNAT